jgi:hypothetical protein
MMPSRRERSLSTRKMYPTSDEDWGVDVAGIIANRDAPQAEPIGFFVIEIVVGFSFVMPDEDISLTMSSLTMSLTLKLADLHSAERESRLVPGVARRQKRQAGKLRQLVVTFTRLWPSIAASFETWHLPGFADRTNARVPGVVVIPVSRRPHVGRPA